MTRKGSSTTELALAVRLDVKRNATLVEASGLEGDAVVGWVDEGSAETSTTRLADLALLDPLP